MINCPTTDQMYRTAADLTAAANAIRGDDDISMQNRWLLSGMAEYLTALPSAGNAEERRYGLMVVLDSAWCCARDADHPLITEAEALAERWELHHPVEYEA